MKLRITPSIPDLLRQLPAGTVGQGDAQLLRHSNEYLKQLRAELLPDATTSLFTQDVRASLALEITDALVQIIKASIPKSPRGRPPLQHEPAQKPSRLAQLEQEWEEKREAKAQLDARRKELQALKRSAMEMREALEDFEKRATYAAGAEIAGMPPNNEQRGKSLLPALGTVHDALAALRAGATGHDRLGDRAEAMLVNWNALHATTGYWCNATGVLAEGKAGGVHKSNALAAWFEACRRLSRDIADELRELK
jgi:hypothetical protein